MATVRSPSSVPARKMRMAISLRFAASSFLNGRTAGAGAPDLLLRTVMWPVYIVGQRSNGKVGTPRCGVTARVPAGGTGEVSHSIWLDLVRPSTTCSHGPRAVLGRSNSTNHAGTSLPDSRTTGDKNFWVKLVQKSHCKSC